MSGIVDEARERLHRLLAERADLEADIATASEDFAEAVTTDSQDGLALSSRSRLVDITTAARLDKAAAKALTEAVESEFGKHLSVVDLTGQVPVLRLAADRNEDLTHLFNPLTRWAHVAYVEPEHLCFINVLTETTDPEKAVTLVSRGDAWAVLVGEEDVQMEGGLATILAAIPSRWPAR